MNLPLTGADLAAIAIVLVAVLGTGSLLRRSVAKSRRPATGPRTLTTLSSDQLLATKLLREPEIRALVGVRETIEHPVGAGRLAVLWIDPADQGVRHEVAERLRDVATLVGAEPAANDLELRLAWQRDRCVYN
jgi:hypothetical protein